MSAPTAAPPTVFDLDSATVRELNGALHAAAEGAFRVLSPAGKHNLAVGLDAPLDVTIDGHAGYYCAGMNQQATVRIEGSVAVGCAENMMSGVVEVLGAAGQSAAATAHGGLLLVRGDAAARCGISLKGADIVVEGSVGHMTGFMAQKGRGGRSTTVDERGHPPAMGRQRLDRIQQQGQAGAAVRALLLGHPPV